LALLGTRRVDVEIVDYLEHPPPRSTLEKLVEKLGAKAIDLVRTNEAEWQALGADVVLDDAQILDLLVKHPRLLQRPIVEIGDRARIGRPPERVLELLE
jgi:arsenate reductase (glutaredoxin)